MFNLFFKDLQSGQISKCYVRNDDWESPEDRHAGYLSAETDLSHDSRCESTQLALSRVIRRLINQMELVRMLSATSLYEGSETDDFWDGLLFVNVFPKPSEIYGKSQPNNSGTL